MKIILAAVYSCKVYNQHKQATCLNLFKNVLILPRSEFNFTSWVNTPIYFCHNIQAVQKQLK